MTEPLDMSKDPDRFVVDPAPVEPLDPAKDPDRYPAAGRTLPELLGDGAYEDVRDNATWAWGLLGIITFLAIVSLVITLL